MATPTIDAGFPKTIANAGTTPITTASFSTLAASLLVAVVSIDNPGAAIVVSGAGLAWTKRASQSLTGAGTTWVEVWTAPSAGALSSQTVSAAFTSGSRAELTVYSVSGANASPIGNTATFQNNTSNTNPPAVTLNAQAANSLIIGGFSNFTGAAAATALGNTTIDASDTGTDCLTSCHATTATAGNITLGLSAPAANFSIAAALEILAPPTPQIGLDPKRGPMRFGRGHPLSRFRAAPVGTVNAPSTAPVPVLCQHVASSSNDNNGINGNDFRFWLPNAVGAGNCLILGLTYLWSAGRTVRIADSNGNVWPTSPAVTTTDGSTVITSIFVLPNANAGPTMLTITFDTAIRPVQYTCSEFNNIDTVSPVDGTTSSHTDTAPNVSAGTFTPITYNDPNGGHLIWSYFADQTKLGSTNKVASIQPFPGVHETLLDANITWTIPTASQYFIQPATGPMTPAMVVNMSPGNDVWNAVGVALRIKRVGTAPPAFRIIRAVHWGVPSAVGITGATLQCPADGNLRLWFCWEKNLTNFTSITDTDGNSYTKAAFDDTCPQFWYKENTSPSSALQLTFACAAYTGDITGMWYDITGADPNPYDGVGGRTQFANGGVNMVTTPFQPASIGLSLAGLSMGNGPCSGLVPSALQGAIFDYVYYTGELDADLMDNADGAAHYYNTDYSLETFNWVYAASFAGTASISVVHFKAAVANPVLAPPPAWQLRGPMRRNGPNPVSRFRSALSATAVAGLGTTYFQSLDGTLAPIGALVKQTSTSFAGTLTSSGALQKQTSKVPAGTLTSSGALQKRTNKILVGALTMSGALAATKVALMAIAGTLTSSGTLQKQTNKVLAGALTASGALLKSTQKVLSGALTSGGTLVKRTNKILAGTLTSSGALVPVKAALISLAGTLTSSGSLVKLDQKNLSGALTSAGALVKSTQTHLVGSLTAAGTVVKLTGKRLAGTLSSIGTLTPTKVALRAIAGTLTASGTLAKQVSKGLAGALVPSGTLQKRAGKAIAGVLAPVGALAKLTATRVSGVLSAAGTVAGVQTVLREIIRFTLEAFAMAGMTDVTLRAAQATDEQLTAAQFTNPLDSHPFGQYGFFQIGFGQQ